MPETHVMWHRGAPAASATNAVRAVPTEWHSTSRMSSTGSRCWTSWADDPAVFPPEARATYIEN
jgi:hypothetical protein